MKPLRAVPNLSQVRRGNTECFETGRGINETYGITWNSSEVISYIGDIGLSIP